MKINNYRKLISLTLALEILISIMTISVSAEEKSNNDYFYSDEYFASSSFEYNNQLSTMSLDLELTTFSNNAESDLTNMMKEIGLENIVTNDLDKSPTNETIGSGIGYKKIGDYNLIAVVIRGGNYEREWASNFLVGTQDNAKGFSFASKKIVERLTNYISENRLTKNKIWITGYSRAGGVSDITGVYINEHLSDFNTAAEDLFVYTFEAPAGCSNNKIYDNIFNIVNINDPVPYVCPEQWRIYSNGKRIEIGTSEKIMTYTQNGSYEYKEKAEFYKEFFSWFTGLMTREEYVDKLEEPLCTVLDIYFSKTPEERQKILGFLQQTMSGDKEEDQRLKFEMMKSFLNVVDKNSDFLYKDLSNKIFDFLDAVRSKDKAKIISDEEYERLRSTVYPLVKAIAPILAADYVYYEGIDYEKYYETENPLYNASDYDWGYHDGAEKGETIGYSDGLNPLVTEMKMTSDLPAKYSDEYAKGFCDGLRSTYPEAYDLGKRHLKDNKARGAYDGEKEGEWSGYNDGLYGEEKSPKANVYLDYRKMMPWCTFEYKEAYKKSFNEAYNENYEKGLQEKEASANKPKTLSLYHTMTIYNNLSNIISAHYPDVNLELLKKDDRNYNSEGKSADRYGDIDNDNNITSYDALMVLRNSVGLQELDEHQKKLADLDQDDRITSMDSLIILRASVKIYDSSLFKK